MTNDVEKTENKEVAKSEKMGKQSVTEKLCTRSLGHSKGGQQGAEPESSLGDEWQQL